MKILRTIIVAALASIAMAGAGDAFAQEADTRTRTTKEERRERREQRISNRATAATQVKVRDGKNPSYSRLLKSRSYKVMYTEGLRYFGMTKRGKDYNSLANLRRAQTLFETAIRSQQFSGTPQADSLYYYFGSALFMSQDFQASQEAFDNFRRQYAASRFLEDAEYKYAMGFYFMAPDSEHDQSVTRMAMASITEYMGRYPETTHREVCEQRMEELRKKLYAKSYENARLYYTIGQYKAAVRALGNAIDEHPESPYREELMYLATRSAWMLARNSVEGQMTDRYLSMMDNYYNLISEYPQTPHLSEVEQMRDEARAYIETHTSEAAETGAETEAGAGVGESAAGGAAVATTTQTTTTEDGK
ncbi:MAG: outer membrane protein assembly factor BamD [Alistipes sp.]|jgi:outer membrane protein assembly factor BamD|nr:outer membrane protein assembly factor BamD [Alistipes sp.]